jgi:hypothetical protein
MAQRLFHPDDDVVMRSDTIITTNGYEVTFPPEFLQDQLRQKPIKWGAYIVDENNNKLDFNRGGVKVATIASGTYATPTAYALAVTAALEAADAPPTWVVSYNATTKFFTIADSGGASFDLLVQTGANAYRSCFADMGWDADFSDQTGSPSYTAIRKSYQSRKYIILSKADGSAASAGAIIIADHNMTLLGSSTVRSHVHIQGNATNAWSAPTLDEELTELPEVNGLEDQNVPTRHYFEDDVQAFEFYRIIIDDVQNPDGYNRLGRLFLGGWLDLAICISSEMTIQRQDFSTAQEGPDGTSFANLRRSRQVFNIGWKEADTGTHAALLGFFRTVAAYRQWFMDFDIVEYGETYYGYFQEPPARSFVPIEYWDWTFTFYEAL